jgi:hypothetical protein
MPISLFVKPSPRCSARMQQSAAKNLTQRDESRSRRVYETQRCDKFYFLSVRQL